MPLNKAGEEIYEKMIDRYGKDKGKRVFYSKENSDKKFRRTTRGSGRGTRRG